MSHQTRSEIVDMLERHGFTPRKAYGQHFLADPNLIDKVVALAGVGESQSVVEVGAGTGALTQALVETGAHVVSYEVDDRLQPVLAEALSGLDVDLRFADVMEVDLAAALGEGPWTLVANLPYNVGTPLLMDVLLDVPEIVSMTVMVQKEVADRLVASPGSRDYGLPSVVVGLTASIVERFPVPPQVFVPAPQVASSVLRLDRVEPPPLLREGVDLARTAFGQRRKMLRRSLGQEVPPAAFAAAGLDGTSRPEQLEPVDFVRLAGAVADA